MNHFESPDETEFNDFDPTSLLDEDLPEDHRSGFVAVIGRPNVGKSTLMNHFLGQKIAIVSPKPQTTRDQLLGILTLPTAEGELAGLPPAQIIFVDTPGIHRPHHKLGEHLVETAQEAITDADLILWLVDASQPSTEADDLVVQSLHEAKRAAGQRRDFPPVLLGLNKVDLVELQRLKGIELPFLDLFPVEAWLPLSAMSSQHRLALLRLMIDHLPLGPRYFPAEQVTDQQTRFIAAELVREAALTVLHQEVPHALAVRVTEFKERREDLVYISANIIVERSSQKQIVIGQKGRTLKQIGKLARAQIEELVDSKVYLELWVKVRPKWRKKEGELRWLGYASKK